MAGLDVAFLMGSHDISGGSNVIFEHAAGLVARGHRVAIVTAHPIDRARLDWHRGAQALTFLDHEACRSRVFDVAVATWWRTVFDLPAVPARRQAYFVQSIETRFAEATDHESRALIDFGYRLPLPVVTEATWIQTYLREHYGREVTLVRNGLRHELFSPDGPVLDGERPHGLRVLVEGAVDVFFKRVPLAITLCQQAGIRDIWLLTLSPRETYPGVTRVLSRVPITEVGAVYRSCDVLVKLSTVEGMFGPPLEMMCAGGTCVTSNVTGHDEYVRDGENALVVPQGEEHRAVEALRRLAADPALLARLRRGARETAAAWPGWDTAVAGMEAFLGDVARCADDPDALRQDLLQVLRAALDLEGPLRVAREHDRQAWYLEYPSWTLLRIAKRLANASARRVLAPRAAEAGAALPAEPAAAAPLPIPHRAAGLPGARPRVCFVGDPARHRAHAPLDGSALEACFISAPSGPDATALAAIRDFRPDFTVVFVPERLTPATAAEVAGTLVGVVTTALGSEAFVHLARTFPLEPADRPAYLVHPDAEVQARLLAGGTNAVAAFLPPVDATFAVADDDPPWEARPVPVVALVDGERTMPGLRRRLRARGDVLEVVAAPSEAMLAPLLRSARLSVHLTLDRGPLLAAKVVRDLVAGCLVVAPRLTVDHGLIAGEHYLMFEREEEAERSVALACLTPERFAVVRAVGRELARRFAPARRWLDLFAQLAPPAAAAASGGRP
jgi:hypothetical protein